MSKFQSRLSIRSVQLSNLVDFSVFKLQAWSVSGTSRAGGLLPGPGRRRCHLRARAYLDEGEPQQHGKIIFFFILFALDFRPKSFENLYKKIS